MSQENRAYFEFIDDLKKSSQKDSPTQEIARMYREVSDILAEAFDEFNPEDLPKYQDRLEGVINLQKQEPSLSDPLFKEDLIKAKSLLDQKVKQRFGAVQKISKLASGTLRTLGGISSHVRDFIAIGDQAAEAGRRVNQINFGSSKRRLDPEEERRQYDVLKGNEPQYSSSQTSAGGPNSPILASTGTGKQVLPVKDDKLIGTNTQQNRVLIQLFSVTKDSNQDIKQIKNLLIADVRERDDRRDDGTLDALEKNQEARASARKKGGGLLEGVVGASGGYVTGDNTQQPSSTANDKTTGGPSTTSTVLAALGIEKAAEWLWSKKGVAWEGTKRASGKALEWGGKGLKAAGRWAPALLRSGAVAETALVAGEAGAAGAAVASLPAILTAAALAGTAYAGKKLIYDPNKKEIHKGMHSLSASIGERFSGLDYYKNQMKDPGLSQDLDSQDETEQWALEYIQKSAREKRERFQKAFKNGSKYGDGSYQKNGHPLNMDEASSDVSAAEEQAKSYREYLEARKKSGKSLGPLAKFSVDGKDYQNPLFSEQEYSQLSQAQISPDILSSQAIHQRLGRQLSNAMDSGDETKEPPFGGSIKAMNKDDVDQMMRMIAAAETGAVTDGSDTSDPRRAIRTKGGSDSSAYGPYQITYSLAERARNKGLFNGDQELQDWVRDRFVPQGKKMINSSYSDPKYGAGGAGDLNNPQDMEMYEKMSRALIADSMTRNDGNTLEVLGEHRFGAGKKHSLMSKDPAYARKALHQLRRDQNRMAANESLAPNVTPVQQSNSQIALNELSKEYDASKSAPVVVQVPTPMPTPQPTSAQPGVSTKSVGASPNGASESSLLLAIRQTVSPF